MNVRIDKLVFGGQGMGKTDDGKIAFVWNALPGEDVALDVIKNKKTHIEAHASAILSPSPNRIEPKEKHFLSCSPWQILSFEEENQWKMDIARETYEKIGGLTDIPLDIVADPEAQYGYRNKIEYSFAEKDAAIFLAFFERGRRQHIPIPGCALASKEINDTAHEILDWINRERIPMRSLKSLIVRSNQNGETIAALFLKDRLSFAAYPALHDGFAGFAVYYSTHLSPASVPTALLHSMGQEYLVEDIRGISFAYGVFSFFQVNVPVFLHALDDIAAHIKPNAALVDYYSGVGAIGLSLANGASSCMLVESNADAVLYAQKNIEHNGLNQCATHCMPAEKMTDAITPDATLILDPPRAGLHDAMVKKIHAVKPKSIIYLSCNLSTHGRDIQRLSDAYVISFLRLYNFFPRTPHIEGLCILEKRSR